MYHRMNNTLLTSSHNNKKDLFIPVNLYSSSNDEDGSCKSRDESRESKRPLGSNVSNCDNNSILVPSING